MYIRPPKGVEKCRQCLITTIKIAPHATRRSVSLQASVPRLGPGRFPNDDALLDSNRLITLHYSGSALSLLLVLDDANVIMEKIYLDADESPRIMSNIRKDEFRIGRGRP